jgi:hypothetical protein
MHAETKANGDDDPLDVCEIGEAIGTVGQVKQVKILVRSFLPHALSSSPRLTVFGHHARELWLSSTKERLTGRSSSLMLLILWLPNLTISKMSNDICPD